VLALAFARFQRCPDGNKRLALILLFTFLAVNGYRLTAEQEEMVQVMLDGANAESDELARGKLSAWIGAHIELVTD
jgi:prophage maintenance system killer protein